MVEVLARSIFGGVAGIIIFAITAGFSLAQTSLQGRQNVVPYAACCKNCSDATCSGCYTDVTPCGSDIPYKATCETNQDNTVCKPAEGNPSGKVKSGSPRGR
jgi:hypothetical protein